MLCIDLKVFSKKNIISKYGVDNSIFDKSHRNISKKQVHEVWDYCKPDI